MSPSARHRIPDDFDAFQDFALEQGWGDGLPLVPPTPERVTRLLYAVGDDADDELGCVPPRNGVLTVEALAVNAAMAGCPPDCFQVVVAAASALLEPRFNLASIQSTTHPCAPLVIVNGPIRETLGLLSRYNCFGQGSRANATIGRAIRLLLLNIGGAAPGLLDRSTQGQPAKYSYCVAENEEESPWPPLHVERGFAASDATVTACGAENPHNINDHVSDRAEGILATIASSMASMGANNAYLYGEPILALGPEHAAILARDGFDKDAIRAWLFEHARIPRVLWESDGMFRMSGTEDYFPEAETMPMFRRPEDLLVIVAGGPGRHSCWMPTFGEMSLSVTRRIDRTSSCARDATKR
jgi:hypothetical protein